MSENIIHCLKKKKTRKSKERDVFARVLSPSVIFLSFKKIMELFLTCFQNIYRSGVTPL